MIKLEQLTKRDIALMRLIQFKYTQARLLPELSDEFTLNLVLGRKAIRKPEPLTMDQKTEQLKGLSQGIKQIFVDWDKETVQ